MKIYSAISNIMSEVGVIGKDKENIQQHFKYRGVDDVMNALQPALINNKVFIVPETLEQIREEKASKSGGTLIYSVCKIKYTFYADDGSNITAVVIGEGMDSGDKATNKAMAIAFKYACFQVFCIPTEEMKDPDSESHELGQKKQDAPQTRAVNGKPDQPSELEKRATAIYYRCTGNKEGQLNMTKEQYKATIKELHEHGQISTSFGKNWTLEDIEFLESYFAELPF